MHSSCNVIKIETPTVICQSELNVASVVNMFKPLILCGIPIAFLPRSTNDLASCCKTLKVWLSTVSLSTSLSLSKHSRAPTVELVFCQYWPPASFHILQQMLQLSFQIIKLITLRNSYKICFWKLQHVSVLYDWFDACVPSLLWSIAALITKPFWSHLLSLNAFAHHPWQKVKLNCLHVIETATHSIHRTEKMRESTYAHISLSLMHLCTIIFDFYSFLTSGFDPQCPVLYFHRCDTKRIRFNWLCFSLFLFALSF